MAKEEFGRADGLALHQRSSHWPGCRSCRCESLRCRRCLVRTQVRFSPQRSASVRERVKEYLLIGLQSSVHGFSASLAVFRGLADLPQKLWKSCEQRRTRRRKLTETQTLPAFCTAERHPEKSCGLKNLADFILTFIRCDCV